MAKHTPGPWAVHRWADNDYEINAALDTVCNVPGFDDDTVDVDRAESNARLIAAAPELLAALKRLLQCYEEYPSGQYHGNEVIADCKLAIATAEGRSE